MKENKIRLEVEIPEELDLTVEQREKLHSLFESAVVEVITGSSAQAESDMGVQMKPKGKSKAKQVPKQLYMM